VSGYPVCKHNLLNDQVRVELPKVSANTWYLFEVAIFEQRLTITINDWKDGPKRTSHVTLLNNTNGLESGLDAYVGGTDDFDLINEYLKIRKVFRTFYSNNLLVTKSIYFNELNLNEFRRENDHVQLFSDSSDEKYKKCPSSAPSAVWSYNCDIVSLALRLNADRSRHMNAQYENIRRLVNASEFNLIVNGLDYDHSITVTILKMENSILFVSLFFCSSKDFENQINQLLPPFKL
jgi:hypothetical protein